LPSKQLAAGDIEMDVLDTSASTRVVVADSSDSLADQQQQKGGVTKGKGGQQPDCLVM